MWEKLDNSDGAILAANGIDDVTPKKSTEKPTESEFKKNLDEAVQWAKDAGYKEADVNDIVKSYRKKKKQ